MIIALSFTLCFSQALLAETSFLPIPDGQKSFYRFDLKKWLYKDEVARQKDFMELKALKSRIIKLKSATTKDSSKLLEAIELKQQMGVIADRLAAFGGLQYAINTSDTASKTEGEDAISNFKSTTAFIAISVQSMSNEKIKGFIAREPKLAKYKFLIQDWRRNQPHTSSESTESLLTQLEPRLDPFAKEFYNLMLDGSPNPLITLGTRTLNVTKPGDYSELMRDKDRNIRESAFLKRLEIFKSQANLYAFALFQKAKTANMVAEYRKFPNASDATLFEYYGSM
jgi:oligoendopeptidase F